MFTSSAHVLFTVAISQCCQHYCWGKGKKGKGKVVPLRSIEAHLADSRYSSYCFLTWALEGGEWSASRSGRALPPGKEPPGTHCTGGCYRWQVVSYAHRRSYQPSLTRKLSESHLTSKVSRSHNAERWMSPSEPSRSTTHSHSHNSTTQLIKPDKILTLREQPRH
jgi:hypothetical protein